ncbi:MAG: hypothetical protein WCG05_02570 [Alphaproteobacteria bacterium]
MKKYFVIFFLSVGGIPVHSVGATHEEGLAQSISASKGRTPFFRSELDKLCADREIVYQEATAAKEMLNSI